MHLNLRAIAVHDGHHVHLLRHEAERAGKLQTNLLRAATHTAVALLQIKLRDERLHAAAVKIWRWRRARRGGR